MKKQTWQMSPSAPSTTSAPSCLSLLPHSSASSHSSLAFEEASFNYDDPLEDEDSQKDDNILESGILARTHKGKTRDTRNDEDGRRHEMGLPGNKRKIGIKLFEGRDQRVESPFAREVTIKGWKIVGGDSWTDVAKLGAYVGGSKMPTAPSPVSSAEAIIVGSVRY